MITRIHSAKLQGIKALDITIETEITQGIGHALVGLADTAIRESTVRTVTALQAKGYHIPGKKIVINLAPTDLHKSGSGYDLPIALSLIAASGQAYLPNIDKWLVIGELGLDGSVRSVPGCLQAVLLAKESGLKGCIIPKDNAEEVRAFADDLPVYAVSSIVDAVRVIRGGADDIPTVQEMAFPEEKEDRMPSHPAWNNLVGNDAAKRALVIAAAGGHDMLIIGPVGSGKSTAAKALAEILPPMTAEEIEETALVYAAAGRRYDMAPGKRTLRAPHYSASMVALLGGGAGENILPGEVSLAHNGILLLDEYAEMPKAAKDALRGPIEDKKVIISRLKSRIEYPAAFQLVLASNPCPCGHYGDGDRCTCTPTQLMLYLSRLSGPVIDHVTLQVWLNPVKTTVGEYKPSGPTLDEARQAVIDARKRQEERYQGTDIRTNDALTAKDIEKYIRLSDEVKDILERLFNQLGLSARSYTRILKLARTIADLDGAEEITTAHVCEAASYRFLDRRNVEKTEE